MRAQRRHARLDMIKELHNGANVLLAHFQYACKGFKPFTLEWNPAETVSMAELDVNQTRFIRQTAVYVNLNGLLLSVLLVWSGADCGTTETNFKKLLEENTYYNEHYLIAQIYEENWKPRTNV